jgi:membrane-bound lytic murein transglycosylase MltF
VKADVKTAAAESLAKVTKPKTGGSWFVSDAEAEEFRPTPVSTPPAIADKIPQMAARDEFAHDPKVIERVENLPEVAGKPAFIKAIIAQESKGIYKAKSPTEVHGLMQVTGDTAREISPDANIMNPTHNVELGSIYISKLLATHKNNPMLALTAYNGGPGVAAAAIRIAKTTDWQEVRKAIPAAVWSLESHWKDEYGWNDKQIATKAKESYEFAERVVANFPYFALTTKDMEMAKLLKEQKVLNF